MQFHTIIKIMLLHEQLFIQDTEDIDLLGLI